MKYSTKISPISFLFSRYKFIMGENYIKAFSKNSTELIRKKKLEAFVQSILDYLEFRNIKGFYFEFSDKKIDIFLNKTLIETYSMEFVNEFDNESRLKFQLFIAYGLLIDSSSKELALIAL